MKFLVFNLLLLVFLFSNFGNKKEPIHNSNFEGIIKYLVFADSVTEFSADTLIYFFGKNKIRIQRKLNPQNEYAKITDEYYDFTGEVNVSYYFDMLNGGLKKITLGKEVLNFNKIHRDSLKTIENEPCYYAILDYKEFEKFQSTFKIGEKIWVAENLNFNLPKEWNMTASIFANKTGKIALYVEKIFTSQIIGETNQRNPKSYLKACEIIPQKLSEEIFDMK